MRIIWGWGFNVDGFRRHDSASRPFQTAVTGTPSLRIFLTATVWFIALQEVRATMKTTRGTPLAATPRIRGLFPPPEPNPANSSLSAAPRYLSHPGGAASVTEVVVRRLGPLFCGHLGV